MRATTRTLSRFPGQINNVRPFFTVINQYQRGVKMFLGSKRGVLEPGFRLDLPFFHNIIKVNMADHTLKIPKQNLISSGNVTVHVSAILQYNIIDPEKAIYNVANLQTSLIDCATSEIRNVLGTHTFKEIIESRSAFADSLKLKLKPLEEAWGINIKMVQLNDVSLDDSMVRAMAVNAEAKLQADAKITNAKSDVETARAYAEASKLYLENPISLRLREFQLWNNVSQNPGTTIYVVPSTILDSISRLTGKKIDAGVP